MLKDNKSNHRKMIYHKMVTLAKAYRFQRIKRHLIKSEIIL